MQDKISAYMKFLQNPVYPVHPVSNPLCTFCVLCGESLI